MIFTFFLDAHPSSEGLGFDEYMEAVWEAVRVVVTVMKFSVESERLVNQMGEQHFRLQNRRHIFQHLLHHQRNQTPRELHLTGTNKLLFQTETK